jgi:ADP-ribose pyrophosphatase YjhB (NUDIX family)
MGAPGGKLELGEVLADCVVREIGGGNRLAGHRGADPEQFFRHRE